MFNDRIELVLHEYFVFEAVLGDQCEKENVFAFLGKLFCLSDGEIEYFTEALTSSAIASVKTEHDYYKSKRLDQYLELIGDKTPLTDEQSYLLSLKGGAFSSLRPYRMTPEKYSASYTVFAALIENAYAGNIIALRILGVLRCTGFGMEKDLDSGCKSLERAAKWGDVISALALLEFSASDRSKYASYALACIKDTPCEYLRDEIMPHIPKEVDFDPDVYLLKKGIEAGRVKRNVYDPVVARVMFSEVIDDEAKEALLFSDNKLYRSDACELPLSLSYAAPLVIDPVALSTRTFGRKSETERFLKNLQNIDIRAASVYTPLCLCSDSRATRDYYFAAIKEAFPFANVVKIRPPFLSGSFDAGKNHLFLRNLVEKKANVLVFFFEDYLERKEVDLFLEFLNGEERKRFRLFSPALTLDLGAILPICICDKAHLRALEKRTDQILIEPLTAEEKPAIVERLYTQYCEIFGMKKRSIAEDVSKELATMSFDNMDSVIRKIFLENREAIAEGDITMEIAEPYLKGKGNGGFSFGFGGNVS